MIRLNPLQYAAIYAIGIIASVLFLWPAAFLMIFFFAHANGDMGNKEADR